MANFNFHSNTLIGAPVFDRFGRIMGLIGPVKKEKLAGKFALILPSRIIHGIEK
jgi:hypothetical protein